MNYHCINVKITWVVSTAALDRENIPALRNPALAFWAVTAVGYTCLRELKIASSPQQCPLAPDPSWKPWWKKQSSVG